MTPEHHVTDNTTTTPTSSEVSVIKLNLHHRRRNSAVVFSSSSSSSASASVNRSSFASNLIDRYSSASDSYEHLAGRGSRTDKCFTAHKSRDFTDRVQKQSSQSEIEEDVSTNSTPVSFSVAFKDCQDRRYKRNISVGVKSGSPRLEVLKKDAAQSRSTSNISSPGTPAYQFPSVGVEKGWNSERMALQVKGYNRVGPGLLPLKTMKTLPSKWEDAERWIFSPANGDSSHQLQLHQQQGYRKPKAKSGPLGPSGSANYSMYTPVIPMSDRRSVGDIMCDSPFSSGLVVNKGLLTTNEDLGTGSPARLDPWMPRSVSLRDCSVDQSSVPSSEDEKVNKMNGKGVNHSCPQSRRDIATQMSSSNSSNSSIIKISSSINEEQAQSSSSFSKMRDVEMDEKLTIGSLRYLHIGNQSDRSSRHVNDSTKKTTVPRSTFWSCKETAVGLGKSFRDEARITAWENLQKAKADAAIKKLEMKLEKEKEAAMNKIMKKLKSAQRKAVEMRMSLLSNQLNQASTSKVRRRSSLSGCFTCHAFELH